MNAAGASLIPRLRDAPQAGQDLAGASKAVQQAGHRVLEDGFTTG